MKRNLGFVFVAAIIFLAGITYGSEKGVLKTEALSSDQADQSGVAVTIYNVNLGLVKDLRSLNLPQGPGELKFMDVASQIIPASVNIKSLIAPDSLRVLEQ